MGALAGGNDDGVDLRAGDDRGIVAGVELRAGFLCQIARSRRFGIGDRQEPDRGMLRRETRAQAPDAAGADDGDA